MLLDQLDSLIQNECRLEKERITLVGVSGGPDSLCLLDVLHRLNYRLVVAHLDHRLRPESHEDAQQVAIMAATRDLPFVLESEDVSTFARQNGLTIEEAARIIRYRFLFAQARRWHAQAVVVGHTADDQVETVLMHLLRGAGLSGLKGMRYRSLPSEWDPEIPLVRPLLGIWREETLSYCNENRLMPVFDPSNHDPAYFRNRLRLEVIPFLETYNPQVRQTIWRTAQALEGDWEVLESVLQISWEACLEEQGPGYRAFNLARFRTYPAGIQRGLVRKGFRDLLPSLRDVDFETVDRALSSIASPPASRQTDLTSGVSLFIEGERVYLFLRKIGLPVENYPQVLTSDLLLLDVPGSVSLGNNWSITAEMTDEAPPDWNHPEGQSSDAWLDAGRLTLPLEVRGRKDGDVFFPLGLQGQSQKLSDFYINVKLPRRLRERWPIVCSAGHIVWVVGFRPAHPQRVTSSSKRLVHLRLSGPGDQARQAQITSASLRGASSKAQSS